MKDKRKINFYDYLDLRQIRTDWYFHIKEIKKIREKCLYKEELTNILNEFDKLYGNYSELLGTIWKELDIKD